MRTPVTIAAFMACLFSASSVSASPIESSCLFLKVLGGNDASSVTAMVDEIASAWPEGNRSEASAALTNVLKELEFAGGSIWQIAKLGEDLEEHLVILRLSKGEVSSARLLYQWSPDGLALAGLDFQRQYPQIISKQFLQTPQPVECP